jgi:hypothetical protein
LLTGWRSFDTVNDIFLAVQQEEYMAQVQSPALARNRVRALAKI